MSQMRYVAGPTGAITVPLPAHGTVTIRAPVRPARRGAHMGTALRPDVAAAWMRGTRTSWSRRDGGTQHWLPRRGWSPETDGYDRLRRGGRYRHTVPVWGGAFERVLPSDAASTGMPPAQHHMQHLSCCYGEPAGAGDAHAADADVGGGTLLDVHAFCAARPAYCRCGVQPHYRLRARSPQGRSATRLRTLG